MVDPIEEIKRLYYATRRSTIQDDFDRAIDLLKTLASEDERERVAVYMEGLAEMRKEWGGGKEAPRKKTRKPRGSPKA